MGLPTFRSSLTSYCVLRVSLATRRFRGSDEKGSGLILAALFLSSALETLLFARSTALLAILSLLGHSISLYVLIYGYRVAVQ